MQGALRRCALALVLATAAMQIVSAQELQLDPRQLQTLEDQQHWPIAPSPDDHDTSEQEVVGGDPTPYFAETVKVKTGPSSFCSGVLIDWRHVLTAGHCGCAARSSYRVTLMIYRPDGGAHLHTTRISGPIVSDPVLYRNFRCGLPAAEQAGRDLALLEVDLDQQFVVEETQRAPERGDVEVDPPLGLHPAKVTTMLSVRRIRAVALTVVGYGRIDDGSVPEGRQYAQVNVVSIFCSRGSILGSRCAPFREFALSNALVRGGRLVDTCSGDSGGPVFLVRKDSDGKDSYALVGVTSRGLNNVRRIAGLPCGGGGIYTAVGHSDVIKWLTEHGVEPEVED